MRNEGKTTKLIFKVVQACLETPENRNWMCYGILFHSADFFAYASRVILHICPDAEIVGEQRTVFFKNNNRIKFYSIPMLSKPSDIINYMVGLDKLYVDHFVLEDYGFVKWRVQTLYPARNFFQSIDMFEHNYKIGNPELQKKYNELFTKPWEGDKNAIANKSQTANN